MSKARVILRDFMWLLLSWKRLVRRLNGNV
jgi:hypothetical protein